MGKVTKHPRDEFLRKQHFSGSELIKWIQNEVIQPVLIKLQASFSGSLSDFRYNTFFWSSHTELMTISCSADTHSPFSYLFGKDVTLNATTTALYIRAFEKIFCWWILQHPIREGFCPFFKAGAIKSEAVAFTNGIRDHPCLLSIVNEGFNDVDESVKI